MATYKTNPRRLCLGVLVALVVDAVMLAPLAVFLYFDPDNLRSNGLIPALIGVAEWIGRSEAPLAGAFGLGGILWLTLSRAGRRSWLYSVSLGSAASFICALVWFVAMAAMKTGGGLPDLATTLTVAAVFSAIWGLIGTVGWWVAWRIAYRKVEIAGVAGRQAQ